MYMYIYIYIYVCSIWYKLIDFSLLLNPAMQWVTHPIFCIPDAWNKLNPTPISYSVASCPK